MSVDKHFTVQFTGEKATLLATLYGRAHDSMADDPILGDTAAADLMSRIDYDFDRFRMRRGETLSVAMRARQLDQWAREFLTSRPDATVLYLGCGLDSRAFRLGPPPGVRWFDLDYPDVIDVRRALYPSPEGYRMIGSSVTDPRWLEEIPADRPALVIAEGLLMYLSESDIRNLFSEIVDRFPSGRLIFDAISPLGTRLQRFTRPVQAVGATFTWALDDPHRIEQWDPRIRLVTALPAADLPGVEKLPWDVRLAVRAMRLIPPLRWAGVLLRYDFTR
ncbi:putative polyketide synthase protein [Planotetraspora thailandica]|uniref:Putative polyketide synthase protein n=1 Tax=Planotetraspora thailandica TaxID=487172 RepID=A0A8J3Y238_9ACTN|nr:class I SAM-dependent methyltransferase [Planotetraspora thailandica]GII59478.1 putative polyketide synthase protein [Planotetraspora thailandica]